MTDRGENLSPNRRAELARAFPQRYTNDALMSVSVLSENRFSNRWQSFPLQVGTEFISIPHRIYYAPPSLQINQLTPLQCEILDCLFTRHHDGFVRQARLTRIILSKAPWIPCFVVPLVGEYVVEILRVIHGNLNHLESALYARFVRENSGFFALTEQRVISYWNCYYRWSIKRSEYPGFLILDYLTSIAKDA